MNPKFKFTLCNNADSSFLPSKAEPNATGYDVKACTPNQQPIIIKPWDNVMIPLGIKVIAPDGWWLKLFPRSSTFIKRHLSALYGVIDQDFHFQLQFCAQYTPNTSLLDLPNIEINHKDAIGQLIPVKRVDMDVEEISNEEFDSIVLAKDSVRKGGFGSTTKWKK